MWLEVSHRHHTTAGVAPGLPEGCQLFQVCWADDEAGFLDQLPTRGIEDRFLRQDESPREGEVPFEGRDTTTDEGHLELALVDGQDHEVHGEGESGEVHGTTIPPYLCCIDINCDTRYCRINNKE